MILSELTARTAFQYFFNTARALFFKMYLLLSMGNGVISTSYENLSLNVNRTLFYIVAILLSLLGFEGQFCKQQTSCMKKQKPAANCNPETDECTSKRINDF